MYQAFYGDSELVGFALIATFVFLAIFVGAIVHAYGRPKQAFEPVAHLPLEDDAPRGPGTGDIHA